LILVGLLGLAMAFLGLYHDVGWIAQPFYAWAWWSWILVLDGTCRRIRGHSLLTRNPRLLPALFLSSVSFWFLFELLNLRFRNWTYVGVFAMETLPELILGGAFVAVCFATVFTGIFETLELVTALGVFDRVRARSPVSLPAWLAPVLQGVGLAMALTAVLFPHYLAPFIWGSFGFLVDPWNYRRGGRSLLRDVERGRYDILLRVLLAGLMCGVVWESFNFLAPQKWLYTVRGLEGLKVFEMPLVGFLGFPALALDSVAAFALVSWLFLGNVTWESEADLASAVKRRRQPRRSVLVALVLVQPLFWGATGFLMVSRSFASLEIELEDLGLSPGTVEDLASLGITRPRRLLRALEDAEAREALPFFTETEREDLLSRIELYTFKGIGGFYGPLLEEQGVHRVEEIARFTPLELREKLVRSFGENAPRLDLVTVWVLAARDRGVVMKAKH
jgi:hypothetical protein